MGPINLLPPEVHQRARARRKRALWLLLGLLYLVLLALIAFYWQTKVGAVQSDLEDRQAANAELEAEIAQLQSARDLKQKYDERVAMLGTILATDVAWGRLLNDVGRVIPDRVWLTSFAGQVQADEANPAALGSITATGVAFEYPDVAAWLRVVDSDQFPALKGAWISSVAVGTIGEAEVVNFTSVASLVQGAVSERLPERVPQVAQ